MAALEADRVAERHPSDGGGEAWLVASSPETVAAGASGTWTLAWRCGPAGVAEGGAIYFQVSPFWGWSTPQTERPDAPGYTVVETAAAGVELAPRTIDQQLLVIEVGGRALQPGEEIRLVYGAGPAGARADRFAEAESTFWFAVDGDGDGVRGLVEASPSVPIAAGPPARLVATVPSTARPGQTFDLTLAILDASGNAGTRFVGEVALASEPRLADLPATVRFEAADGGLRRLRLTTPAAGIVRIAGQVFDRPWAANPLQVSTSGARILWGDLQNHTARSDGTGTPEDLFEYARDVAVLDVVSVTDHDHWGMRFLDQSPDLWDEARTTVARFHEPGRFVALLGWEWTSWTWGHRHVVLFDEDEGPLASALDPRTATPDGLWAALEGRKALTFAHHSAGGPIGTDWTVAPSTVFEPVTEIVSVHGASEAADAPIPIHRPQAGNFVRDALDLGYRLGFIGSSDGHDGHPGLGHLASPSGGLAAILAEEVTRDAVWTALKARRVYATSGPRILLRTTFGGHRMGAEIPIGSDGPEPGDLPGIPADTLVVQVWAPSPLERIDVVRSGAVVGQAACEGRLDCQLSAAFGDVAPGEYLYVRAVQEDRHAAWSSPFFFDSAEQPRP